MLKLKLQYFGHLMRRVDSLEKTLMLGGLGGRRRRGQQRMRWLDGITDSMDMSLSELRVVGDGQGSLACCDSWGRKKSDTTEWLNWTELSRSHKVRGRWSGKNKYQSCGLIYVANLGNTSTYLESKLQVPNKGHPVRWVEVFSVVWWVGYSDWNVHAVWKKHQLKCLTYFFISYVKRDSFFLSLLLSGARKLSPW